MDSEIFNKCSLVGWFIAIARTRIDWKGNQFLSAKEEFYSLLLKLLNGESKIELTLVTDEFTFEGFYKKWIEELGFSKLQLKGFNIIVLSIPYADVSLNNREYLGEFFGAAHIEIDELTRKRPDLALECPPEWLEKHVKYQEDLMLGIWQ